MKWLDLEVYMNSEEIKYVKKYMNYNINKNIMKDKN